MSDLRAEVKRLKEPWQLVDDRITQYLTVGGFFNPELMEHDLVRDLLLDIRGTIRDVMMKAGGA